MYKCINSSKSILKQSLCDGKNDCDYKDDEECSSINDSCSNFESENVLKCGISDICIPLTSIEDGVCDCGYDEFNVCQDENPTLYNIKKYISFPTICDGFTELMFLNTNETDETECEHWECNNTYTRCDGFWNCLNGADEVDCDLTPIIKCSPHNHICVSLNTHQFICLPINQANDGIIDCVGGTDEPQLCRSDNHKPNSNNLYCNNGENRVCIIYLTFCSYKICNVENTYEFCNEIPNNSSRLGISSTEVNITRYDIEKYFFGRKYDDDKPRLVYFSLERMKNSIEETKRIKISSLSSSIIQQIDVEHQQRCHRGLILRVWLDSAKELSNDTCLCPPSFYGNMCQYQNERVSLTLQFQTYSDSRRTLFAVVVLLTDDSDERLIHSYHQFSYLYVRDCKIKFNMYLLYLTRPKDEEKNYSIHIYIYEKISLLYRTSFLIPIKFPFLPVNRIGIQLNIPRTTDDLQTCRNVECVNGECYKYSDNSENVMFCHCYRGWSGRYCTISHNCTCSSDSLCLGILANNRSLCICPNNKWGSQCLFRSTICDSNKSVKCLNGGQCISNDEHIISNKKFKCICLKGFTGERCQIRDNQIIIKFDENIILPKTILIHFIEIIQDGPPINGSTFKIVPINERIISVYWSYPFHIVFAELLNNSYYLINVEKFYNQSSIISKIINLNDRCPHINEVLNETFIKYDLIRRIKFYNFPCQRHSPQLSCFYDENYFCLCNNYGQKRLSNCFEFNYKTKLDCFGQSNCKNDAHCLQDKLSCPQTSTCVCSTCFYGRLCQFSARQFGLSLDDILGYQIEPHITITQQPFVVKLSLSLTIIITIAGFINSCLSIITFNNFETRQIGCGIYLINISFTTLFTMIIFALKFLILLFAQMKYITNQLFLKSQCISIDFLLRIGLNMDQWLSACVSIERLITTKQGIQFNKIKSKQRAKYIIIIILFVNIVTTIHDPIHRHLIDDENDEMEIRRWCIVTYSSRLQYLNRMINIFHFLIPFLINFISGPFIIIITARRRVGIHNNESYRIMLHKQFKEHRHLLISSIVLVILGIPRLIITLISGCMKSIDDPLLFLIGYLISFIPSMLTFIVFVLPSKTYKQQFSKAYQRYIKTIQTRLHINY